MNLRECQKLCKKTAKKFDNMEKEILTWGLGIAGEAGDVAGCIKKPFLTTMTRKPALKRIREIPFGILP